MDERWVPVSEGVPETGWHKPVLITVRQLYGNEPDHVALAYCVYGRWYWAGNEDEVYEIFGDVLAWTDSVPQPYGG